MNNIEILEKLKDEQYTKETVNTLYEFYDEEFKPYVLSTDERNALENLIKENKELKDKCKELNFKYTAQWVDDNFIPKSKVKDKIEYLKSLEFGTDVVTQSTANLTTICILQELLEEGE
jgi:hypothetical protein